jgi:predicted RecB family nuclease
VMSSERQVVLRGTSGAEVMAAKLTKEILEAYLNCKYKAQLTLAGQQGSKSDYEQLLAGFRREVRQQAIGKILARHSVDEVEMGIPMTFANLNAGPWYVLDAILEDDLISLRFDGLKRIEVPSKLGHYGYAPVLFHEGRKFGKEQRVLLELYGLILARLQGHMPSHGEIWHGKDCRTTRVRLNADLRKTERLLREVKDMVAAKSPRKLNLNDHCQICEFRKICRDQAIQEDSVSLLRGLGEKEISVYARKGIFTVTQLAHTFRPKRRGKRATPKVNHRYHALQALAVRDRRVYVLGTLSLPVAPVHIYLDIEGNPEEGFDYLVGMIVVEGGDEEHFSFWADSRDQEDRIFEQFLEIVSLYPDFLMFAYGSYERVFLQKMRKRAKQKNPVDNVLNVLVNTLSLIYSHIYFPTYSNGLKDIGGCLGCSWTEPDSSGVQSLVWRKRWENTRSEDWKKTLIAYNLEDCEALRRVTDFIYTHCAKPVAALDRRADAESCPIVASVDEIDRLGTVKHRGRKEFFHTDFARINECARFDYQRQRVYLRLGKRRRRKEEKEPRTFRNRNLRVNQRVVITSRKCPACGSHDITRPAKAHFGKGCFTKGRRAFDLVFTSGGIIPHAAMSETSSNCWKLSVISVASPSACLDDKPSCTSWMAARKSLKVGW